MKKVYKYSIAPSPDPIKVMLPRGAQILHLDEDGFGRLCYWALVDPEEKEEEEVYLYCIGTGWEVGIDFLYVGSVVTAAGYVWHLFKKEKE